MFTSSTGQGIKLRITSFALLLIPIINTMLQDKGVHIAPEGVQTFIDSFFVVAFGFIHIYGWLRSFKKPVQS
jgi:hypothetical protein